MNAITRCNSLTAATTGNSIYTGRHAHPALRRVAHLLSAIVFLATLGACGGGGGGGASSSPASSVVNTSDLSGKVSDSSGLPVAGVTVYAYHHNDHSTVTATSDSSGNFAFSGLSAGQYTSGQWSDFFFYAQKSGFGFVPSVSDPAGAASRLDFDGLYRTGARFAPMPARTIQNVNFTALKSGNRLASMPRTGQTTSYASGDDFSAKSGVAWPSTRFVDNQNGTVSDNLTGLVWLKNAGCSTPADWATSLASANQLANGQCGLSDGSTAGQWRMPNIIELESLIDVSMSNPSVSAGHPFTNISQSKAYWSSTTYTALPSNAMAIRFTDGRWINGIDSGDTSFNNAKTGANALWAVKSGRTGAIQLLSTGLFPSSADASTFGPRDDAALGLGMPLPYPRFIDNGDGTLSDTATGLVWLKKADCIKQPWSGALATISALASGQCGLSDGSAAGQWRMPNRNEMLSLSDRAPTFPQANYLIGQYLSSSASTGPIIFNNFVAFDYYWTSTTDAADTTQAWSVYSCDFGVYNLTKSSTKYSLAVR